jgi:hypothetical protein
LNWLDEAELEQLEDMENREGTDDQRKERFKITDLSSLNWALRKLKALEKGHDEELRVAQEELSRIQDWFAKQDKSYQSSKQFIEGLIAEFAKGQIEVDPKWKGSKTPYGKVNFHKQKDQWEYDEEALVAYLEGENKTSLLKVKKEPIKELIKDFYTLKNGRLINENTGEVIPGVAVTEREPKLSIKLEG